MESASRYNKNLFVTLGTVVLTFLLALSAWLYFLAQEKMQLDGYMQGIALRNGSLAEQMTVDLRNGASGPEQALEIVSSAPADGVSYWSLIVDDTVVYEKNDTRTGELSGMSLDELTDEYIRQGGTGITELANQIRSGQPFSVLMVKEVALGNELISGAFVEIDGQSYCVTVSIMQSYLLSSTGYAAAQTQLRILVAVSLLVSVAAVSYLSILNYRKKLMMRLMEKDLQDKNILIQEQGDRLFADSDEKVDNVSDIRTGLYTEDFFRTVMSRLPSRNIASVGFLSIRLDQLALLYGQYGYQTVTSLIQDAAETLMKHLSPKEIAARVGKAEFAVIILGSSPEELSRLERKIAVSLVDLDAKATFSCGWALCGSDETLDAAYQRARKAAGVA